MGLFILLETSSYFFGGWLWAGYSLLDATLMITQFPFSKFGLSPFFMSYTYSGDAEISFIDVYFASSKEFIAVNNV